VLSVPQASPPFRPNLRGRWRRTRILATGCLLLITASLAAAGEITLPSLLGEMTDYSAVARWPAPGFTTRQCSSYDRAEVAPDQPGWFANADFSQYLREEKRAGRREMVMMDANGPGCIVRFWLTTTQNKKGTLRIYLDGNPRPLLQFPAFDLLSGDLHLNGPLDQPHPGYGPTENGGNTLMLPIPYAKHCEVTWEEAGDGPRYYQIDYRTYAPGTKVQTLTRQTLKSGWTTSHSPLFSAPARRITMTSRLRPVV